MPDGTPRNSNASESQLQAALDEALRYARKKVSGDELRERCIDAGTDAVLFARRHFDPAAGDWLHYTRRLVRQFISRAITKYREQEKVRPDVRGFAEFEEPPARAIPSAGNVPMTPELRDLPADLRDTVRLYLIDGYTMRDVGLLTGVSEATARNRLIEAAKELAPGQRPRAKSGKALAR